MEKGKEEGEVDRMDGGNSTESQVGHQLLDGIAKGLEKEVVYRANGGVGFLGLMFLVFMTLKLTGTISWSWWWVTAPLWAGPVLILGVLLAIVAFLLLFGLVQFICDSCMR